MKEGWNLEFTGAVARLTLNRPLHMNALNTDMISALDDILDELEAREEARVLLLSGGGEKAFIAGADIDEMTGMDAKGARAMIELGHRVFNRLETLAIPVIAALNGHTLGGGLELALCADFRICTANAKLGLPEIKLGVSAGWGGPFRLVRLIGSGRAKDLFFRGRLISAEEACSWGLVTAVFPTVEALRQAADELAMELAEKAPLALRVNKQMMNDIIVSGHGLNAQRDAHASAFLFGTEDAAEGIKAFREKRKPDFHSR